MPDLTRKIVFFIVFTVTTCFAGIPIETTGPAESKLVEATVQILNSCYGSRITPVGLAGNLTGMVSKAMSLNKNLLVTLIEADSRIVVNSPTDAMSRYKLQVFVVTASSSLTLTRTLKQIQSSIWWNHMAHFLILDWPGSEDGCSNPFELLWAAWDMNILNANLMCYNRTENRLIYTFNPYTSWAPDPWKLVKIYSGKSDHPWTLLVRSFKAGRGVCDELDFEKTNDLGGYEIRVSVTDTSLANEVKSDNMCVSVIAEIVCRLFFPALKATAKVLLHNSTNSIGYVDDKGKSYGIMGEVANGTSDFSAMPRPMSSMANLTASYPYGESEIRAVTQYSGYKTQLSKIRDVIDTTARFCLCLVLLVTVVFFRLLLRQTLTLSLLSTLRMVCNSSLLSVPDSLVPRIYLGSLFIFVVTMQGIYQGKLASLLTNEQSLPNVNTMKDLAKLGHTIYGAATYRSYFDVPELKGRYVATLNQTCTEYVLQDPKAACVAQKYISIRDVIKYKLHMTRDTLIRVPGVLPIRPDWPLEKRFNTLGLRFVATYQLEYMVKNVSSEWVRLIDIQEKEYIDESLKVLTLDKLNFAFAILGIGLTSATISFIVEIILDR